jgi:beta-xylosidase
MTSLLASLSVAQNSTYNNPILPGFHPDPSCILVPEWDNTFFCASSSFLAFPGVPIHASRDLQKWKLISNALNRPSQLPELNDLIKATSGIWAATIRYRNGTFYLVTTMVHDDLAKNDTTRFVNIIMTSTNPYSSASWSDPVHFDFEGYDTSPFWDDNGKTYITGTFAWEVTPGIQLFPINLKTGERGNITKIWDGTGGEAPEGPHLRRKDGYYYLNIAEGGTGANHMVTMARSKNIAGPYESNPKNTVLTNANTTAYLQDVGHADLFQDVQGKWWAVALAVREAPDTSCPMGRETVLTPVTWEEGEWPIFTNVSGHMNGWHLDSRPPIAKGEGSLIDAPVYIDFAPGTAIPPEFVHWRFPNNESFVLSPPGHPKTLQLTSSTANLTGLDGNAPQQNGAGQTFIGRRQVDSLFTFSATFDISQLKEEQQEIGVTAFLDQVWYLKPSMNVQH